MSNYLEKYKKYKTKYICLKQSLVGGNPAHLLVENEVERSKNVVLEILSDITAALGDIEDLASTEDILNESLHIINDSLNTLETNAIFREFYVVEGRIRELTNKVFGYLNKLTGRILDPPVRKLPELVDIKRRIRLLLASLSRPLPPEISRRNAEIDAEWARQNAERDAIIRDMDAMQHDDQRQRRLAEGTLAVQESIRTREAIEREAMEVMERKAREHRKAWLETIYAEEQQNDGKLLSVLSTKYDELAQDYKDNPENYNKTEPMRHTVCGFNSPYKAFSAYFNGIELGGHPRSMFAKCGITKMCCSISGCKSVTPEIMEDMLGFGTYTIGIGYSYEKVMDVQIPGILTGKVEFGETMEKGARREIREELGLTDRQFWLEKISRGVYRMQLTLDDAPVGRDETVTPANPGDKISVLFAGSEQDMLRIARNISGINSDNISHFVICPVQVSISLLRVIRDSTEQLSEISTRYFVERDGSGYTITLARLREQSTATSRLASSTSAAAAAAGISATSAAAGISATSAAAGERPEHQPLQPRKPK